jgi:hypothetical protein
MMVPGTLPGSTISTILRHDAKVTSYKIALLRAINDVVLGFPDVLVDGQPIAIPLRILATYWIGYYWPFIDPTAPIRQGPQFNRAYGRTQDISFRPALEALYQVWLSATGSAPHPTDGFFLVSELRTLRTAATYPSAVHLAYTEAISAIADAMLQPIQYAGPRGEQWTIFPRPVRYRTVHTTIALPGTQDRDRCLILSADLWRTFRDVSLWVEALCVHEWCLFTERVEQDPGRVLDRGDIYRLLTSRPENRRPLTWERNHVDVLLMEGVTFTCPWTEQRIVLGRLYDIDHILPVSVYPINELWNLVPADSSFNQHVKRDRLPSIERLARAEPHLARTYTHYHASSALKSALTEDVALRFRGIIRTDAAFPEDVAQSVTRFIDQIGTYRNLARF